MRILVCGGRNFFSYPIVQLVLDRIKIEELATNGDVGTSGLVEAYAKANDIPYVVIDEHPLKMIHQFNPDIVVIFPGKGKTQLMKQACIDDCKHMLIYNEQGQLTEI